MRKIVLQVNLNLTNEEFCLVRTEQDGRIQFHIEYRMINPTTLRLKQQSIVTSYVWTNVDTAVEEMLKYVKYWTKGNVYLLKDLSEYQLNSDFVTRFYDALEKSDAQ